MKQLTVLRVLLLAELNFKINFKIVFYSQAVVYLCLLFILQREAGIYHNCEDASTSDSHR